MLEAALSLAKERGWHVFPCLPWDQPKNAKPKDRGKAPLIEAGYKGATTEERQIRQWWTQWPNANIGVACGASGIAVLDIDGAEGWRQIEYGGYDLPDTLTQRTGKRGGKHLIMAAGNHGLRNQTKIFGSQGDAEGVDIRGDGGYIVVAPSRHYSGNFYEFEDPDVPLADVPLWLIGHQRAQTGRLAGARKLILSPDEMIHDGERNDRLYDIGCVYRRDNMIQDPEIMQSMLMAENQRRCDPPLDAAEVRKIAESAVKVLPDEIELPPAGWGSSLVGWAKQTGDPATLKKAEALRVEIEDKLPDPAHGKLALGLIRYTASGVDGGTFSATVTFKGREVALSGLTGEDLNRPDSIKAKCLAEKLVIVLPKRKQWDALLEAAMSQCVDVEVPREVSVVGACAEVILEAIADLTDTDNWEDFPKGNGRYRFDHGDGTYSVHSETLRQVVRKRVWDSKRQHITEAFKAVGAIPHHAANKSKTRMQRVRLADG